MIELGSVVRDKITGLQGIAVARTEWVHGCTRYGVQPTKLHEMKPIDPQWFDEPQLEIVQAEKPKPAVTTGGPQRDPSATRPGE